MATRYENYIANKPLKPLIINSPTYTVNESDTYFRVTEKILDENNLIRKVAVVDDENKVRGVILKIDMVNYLSICLKEMNSKNFEIPIKDVLESTTANHILEICPSYPSVDVHERIGDLLSENKKSKHKHLVKFGQKGAVVLGEKGEYRGFVTYDAVLRETFATSEQLDETLSFDLLSKIKDKFSDLKEKFGFHKGKDD